MKRLIDDAVPNEQIQRQVIAVDIRNISDWFFEGNDKEYWSVKEFSCITLPWPITWFEAKGPKRIVSKECGNTENTPPYDWGCFAVRITPEKFKVHVPEKLKIHIPLAAKWINSYVFYHRTPNEKGYIGETWVAVGENGEPLQWEGGWFVQLLRQESWDLLCQTLTNIICLAINFANCKNIEIITSIPAKIRTKQNRHRLGWRCSYKTIKINNLKRLGRSNSENIGGKQALTWSFQNIH